MADADDLGAVADLTRRAEAGDGAAAHRLAILSLMGLGTPHDPSSAERWLAHAAACGDELAAGARALIEAEGGLANLTAPVTPHLISRAPHVLSIDGFVSPAVCDWMIQRALPSLDAAHVYDNAEDRRILSDARDNSYAVFPVSRLDFVMAMVRERIARVTGLPVAGLEAPQVLHYAPGQKFDAHRDYLDPARPGHRVNLQRNGQRVATFLVYLNDGFEGGETEMASIGLKHRGATGDALFWANVTPDGRPDPGTLHAGLPPTSGEKWVLSQWLRNRAPNAAQSQDLG